MKLSLFSLSHSFPSLSILNRHAEHINTFQQATRKIRQKHFCWKQYNELDTIYQALLLKEENHFVNFIEERTYCLSREFGFQDFDEFLANRSHPKGVLVLKSTFFILFYFSSCPTKLREGVLEKTTKLFFMSSSELHKRSAKQIKLSFDYHFITSTLETLAENCHKMFSSESSAFSSECVPPN